MELAEAALERARRNAPGADLRLVAPDGSLPLGHGEVDLVWCSEVLEHVPDTVAFLTEVRRVLRRERPAAASPCPTTAGSSARCSRSRHYDAHYDPLGQHVRFYTRRSLARALRATGFADVRLARARRPAAAAAALVARAVRG